MRALHEGSGTAVRGVSLRTRSAGNRLPIITGGPGFSARWYVEWWRRINREYVPSRQRLSRSIRIMGYLT